MNLQDVCNLVDRFESSSLSELQLELDNMKLVCKKGSVTGECVTSEVMADKPVKVSKEPVKASVESGVEIKAKIAGTFYRAESPDSKPFVQVGQKVEKGQVIGMIEAMKMMNNIVSPVDGEVASINVSNEELVGFDDLIAVIKTS